MLSLYNYPHSTICGFLFVSMAIICLTHSKQLHANDSISTVKVVKFATYTADRPSVTYKRYYPLLNYLAKTVSQSLDSPVRFKFRVYKTYKEAQVALINREFDFTTFGAASYVLIKQRIPSIKLLVNERINGQNYYYGFIFTRTDSDVMDLEDLNQRTFAFGNELSTFGRYLSQSLLLENQINSRSLAKFSYLGNHEKVMRAILNGDYEVGAVRSSTFKYYPKDLSLRVIASKKIISRAWLANDSLSHQLFLAIQQQMILLKEPNVLKAVGVDSFRKAKDSEYDDVRNDVEISSKF